MYCSCCGGCGHLRLSPSLSLSLPLFDFLDRCGRHGVAQRHATALVACSIPIPDIGSRFFFQEAFESKHT